mmetsp:Transcript_76769/g.217147  ORF Transcript_76769/g.217147 Transcript_76769/m.217147 type:complete len:221 (-) Transcript_76769:29-691(-)
MARARWRDFAHAEMCGLRLGPRRERRREVVVAPGHRGALGRGHRGDPPAVPRLLPAAGPVHAGRGARDGHDAPRTAPVPRHESDRFCAASRPGRRGLGPPRDEPAAGDGLGHGPVRGREAARRLRPAPRAARGRGGPGRAAGRVDLRVQRGPGGEALRRPVPARGGRRRGLRLGGAPQLPEAAPQAGARAGGVGGRPATRRAALGPRGHQTTRGGWGRGG